MTVVERGRGPACIVELDDDQIETIAETVQGWNAIPGGKGPLTGLTLELPFAQSDVDAVGRALSRELQRRNARVGRVVTMIIRSVLYIRDPRRDAVTVVPHQADFLVPMPPPMPGELGRGPFRGPDGRFRARRKPQSPDARVNVAQRSVIGKTVARAHLEGIGAFSDDRYLCGITYLGVRMKGAQAGIKKRRRKPTKKKKTKRSTKRRTTSKRRTTRRRRS